MIKSQDELAELLAIYMRSKKMSVPEEPDTYTIVYLEGSNADGKPNPDEFDKWNDRRIVIGRQDGNWKVFHNALATTEPGRFYTMQPMTPKGAARIAFGQYEAWRHGKHNGVQPALIQVRPITVHRDMNKNGIRDVKDRIETGLFNMNHHTTSRNFNGQLIGKFSAGCPVGYSYALHLQFLGLVSRDVRFLDNIHAFLYSSAFVAGDAFYRHFFGK